MTRRNACALDCEGGAGARLSWAGSPAPRSVVVRAAGVPWLCAAALSACHAPGAASGTFVADPEMTYEKSTVDAPVARARPEGGPDMEKSVSAPVAAGATLPGSTKGYELYAWEDADELRYTLVTGTNRVKTVAEIMVGESEVHKGEWLLLSGSGDDGLPRAASRVPAGTTVILTDLTGLPSLSERRRANIKSAVAVSGH